MLATTQHRVFGMSSIHRAGYHFRLERIMVEGSTEAEESCCIAAVCTEAEVCP